MSTKLRSAGLAIETLPGPALLPPGLEPLEIAQRGLRWRRRTSSVSARDRATATRRPLRCCSTRSVDR